MAQRSFKLSDELDAKIVKLADQQGRTVSNLIVWVLDQYAAGMMNPRWSMPELTTSEKELSGLKNIADGALDDLGQRVKARADVGEGTPLPKIARRKQR